MKSRKEVVNLTIQPWDKTPSNIPLIMCESWQIMKKKGFSSLEKKCFKKFFPQFKKV